MTASGNGRPADGSPAPAALINAIRRVEATLREETEALNGRAAVDLDGLSRRKSQGLLELSRIGRTLEPGQLDAASIAGLTGLRAALEENRATLALHLAAAEEIAGTLTRALRDADSDGTYSSPGGWGERC